MLNRGEAVNALKRAIYTGRVAVHQARRDDEMQAVADALSLLANIVMAWNTAQMQAVIDRWNNRRREQIPAKLIGRIAPTRIFNLRGVFRFPIERFAGQILPSLRSPKNLRQRPLAARSRTACRHAKPVTNRPMAHHYWARLPGRAEFAGFAVSVSETRAEINRRANIEG